MSNLGECGGVAVHVSPWAEEGRYCLFDFNLAYADQTILDLNYDQAALKPLCIYVRQGERPQEDVTAPVVSRAGMEPYTDAQGNKLAVWLKSRHGQRACPPRGIFSAARLVVFSPASLVSKAALDRGPIDDRETKMDALMQPPVDSGF
jgi:hypothetical protein